MTRMQSTTDPDARLYKKAVGREAKLGVSRASAHRESPRLDCRHGGHGGDRHRRTGRRDRDARRVAADDPSRHRRRRQVYDTRDWVAAVRQMRITPHVAASVDRRGGSAIDGRTLRHAGYVAQPTQAEAGRASLRLDENRRASCANSVTAADDSSTGSLPSPPPRTTSSAGAISWRNGHDDDGDRRIRIIAMNTSPFKRTKNIGAEPHFFSTLLVHPTAGMRRGVRFVVVWSLRDDRLGCQQKRRN